MSVWKVEWKNDEWYQVKSSGFWSNIFLLINYVKSVTYSKMTEDSNGTIKTVSDISMETGCCMAKKLKNVSNKNHKKKRSQRKLSQKLYSMAHIIWCISNAVIYQSKRGQDGIKLSSGVTLLLNGSESFVKIDRDSKDSLSIPVIKCRLEIFRSLVTKLWFSFSTGTNPFGLP